MSQMAKRIGDRIRARRLELDWDQDELARRLEVTQSAISNYERGTRSIAAEDLPNVAEVLMVDIDFFYSDDSEEHDLQNDEAEVIGYYRGVPSDLQPTARALLKTLLDQARANPNQEARTIGEAEVRESKVRKRGGE